MFSKSSDGVNWSDDRPDPDRERGQHPNDHFIPGIGVEKGTSGSGAHVALTYYFYTDANCAPADCVLQAGTISSSDGGAHGPARSSWRGRCRSARSR